VACQVIISQISESEKLKKMASKAPAINPLVKPLIEGYQERMQKYKNEFETLQKLSKQCGTDYTMLA